MLKKHIINTLIILSTLILTCCSCNHEREVYKMLNGDQSETENASTSTSKIYNYSGSPDKINYKDGEITYDTTASNDNTKTLINNISGLGWEKKNEDGTLTGIILGQTYIQIYNTDIDGNVNMSTHDVFIENNTLFIENPLATDKNFKYHNYTFDVNENYAILSITDEESHNYEYERVYSGKNALAHQLMLDQQAINATTTTTTSITIPYVYINEFAQEFIETLPASTTAPETTPEQTSETTFIDGRTKQDMKDDMYNKSSMLSMDGMKWLSEDNTILIITTKGKDNENELCPLPDYIFDTFDKNETPSSKKSYKVRFYKNQILLYTDNNEYYCMITIDHYRKNLQFIFPDETIKNFIRIPRDENEVLHEYSNTEHP